MLGRVALALVLALLIACDPQSASQSRPPASLALATPSFTAEEAVRAVLSSPEAAATASLFPSAVGSGSCELRAGAVRVVPATCRIEVRLDGPTYVVMLTEVWDAARFHHVDDPAAGPLEHSWTFFVNNGGPLLGSATVSRASESGAFPPQAAR